MKNLLSTVKIRVNEKIYAKDPETSELGKKIIRESILLIDEIGFDHFTFKKLGLRIGSNESSIYRYFDNKHKLLVYLSSWYWGWTEYKLVLKTTNVADPVEKLKAAIAVVTEKIEDDITTLHINEKILNRIIIFEFTKIFQTKEVDEENKEGFFLIYKSVINRVVEIASALNPSYPYTKSLVSALVEGALHQHFLSDHLKSITNANKETSVTDIYTDIILKTLRP
ncbi:MAG TPA: TetR/AcrR family transcriptional regulator [Flavobacterium sp.]|jgi:AcrR family transcriptional regulator